MLVGFQSCNHVRERERLIKLYFSTMKILAQRATHISAVATVLQIERKTETERQRQTETVRERHRHRRTDSRLTG